MSSHRRLRQSRLKAPRSAYTAPGGGAVGGRFGRTPPASPATAPAVTSFEEVSAVANVLVQRANESVARPTLTLRFDPLSRAVIGIDVS